MANFSYYDGRGSMYWSLNDARKAIRKALRIDPASVKRVEYWSDSEKRIKYAYIKRVSSSGAVKYYGIY